LRPGGRDASLRPWPISLTPVYMIGALRRTIAVIVVLSTIALTASGCRTRAPLPAAEARSAPAPLRARLQALVDSLQKGSGYPGISVGVAGPSGSLGVAAGLADTARREPLSPRHLLLQGSVGKTYAAALALQLVAEGKLDLDAPIARYLGRETWFARLPNADRIRVRHLMNHTSGLVRYEFGDAFTRALSAQPDRVWRPEELVAFIFGEPAPFAPGEGWEYSDTNYIVLGMILEKVSGRRVYEEVERRFLRPLALTRTVPSDRRRISGLAQGYAGPRNPFGGTDAMVLPDGRFAINPQFEWTGGGMASTTEDLARWAFALYGGQVLRPSELASMLQGVPAPLGPQGTTYGLGVIVRPLQVGTSWGHSGFFPGYLTEMMYFPAERLAVAVQVNSSAAPRGSLPLGRVIVAVLQELRSRN
jgi:D-alanyl-D-alanine carboxypeptidase